MEPINLEDYQGVIRSLVWKFRNLGFADSLYAPVIESGVEGSINARFSGMSEDRETRTTPFTVKNFEDLISEGYVVFTELKNQFDLVNSDFCQNCCIDKCQVYHQIKGLVFEQALVTRLESRFTNLYLALMTQKRKAHVRYITEADEEKLSFTDSTIATIMAKGYKSLDADRQMIIDAIINKEIVPSECGRITKSSIFKYLTKKGWKQKKIRHFLYEILV